MFISLLRAQLAQLCNENPDIIMLKVDFDENRDIVKPLAIKVRKHASPQGAVWSGLGKGVRRPCLACKQGFGACGSMPECGMFCVQVLPYFHFYRGSGGRVAAFSASVSKIQRLR